MALPVSILPRCAGNPALPGAVRLLGGVKDRQGRVEMLRQGAWMPLCAHNFGLNAAQVICRQLGLAGSVLTVEAPDRFGTIPSGVPFLYLPLDDMYCDPAQSVSLLDCKAVNITVGCFSSSALTCTS